ncbi:MAG: hypothetical protein JO257_38090 [Deltaproteobacteria bacterium]|nr:hypothetical protein [Deltaproteobacteria bacterium]
MGALDEALAAALAVPLKQLATVVSALIDMKRVVPVAIVQSLRLPETLRAAAVIRAQRVAASVDTVLSAKVRPDLQVASLILAAPALDTKDWERVDVTLLPATMPLVPKQVVRRVIGKPFAGQRELADRLASVSPFVKGRSLELVRQRSMELTDPAIRKAVVIAIDTGNPPSEFRKALGTSASLFPNLEWWETSETAALLENVRRTTRGDPDAATKLARAIDQALARLGSLGGGWTHAKPKLPTTRIELGDLRGDDRGLEPATVQRPRVSIGVALDDSAAQPVQNTTLAPDTRYWLWFEIAPDTIAGAAPGGNPELPRDLEDTDIDVVLFAFADQLEVDETYRRGTVRVIASRSRVVTPAATPAVSEARLFFPIRTPSTPGNHAVRISLYHNGCLVQSHVLTTIVRDGSADVDALRLATDFSLTRSFDLKAFARADLSILLNDDPGTGTHSFRFFRGADKVAADATIDGTQLTSMINFARGALRLAAWGTRNPWRTIELDPYQYGTPDLTRLQRDLIMFAVHGCRLFTQALLKFRQGAMSVAAFRAALRAPGVIQLGLKQGTAFVFPISLVYDFPLDPDSSKLSVCGAFLANVQAGADLAGTPCLAGQCPHYENDLVVCPGGFWGFRHQIGMPPDLQNVEATADVGGPDEAAIAALVSTDEAFVGREAHIQALAKLAATKTFDDRIACLLELKRGHAHVEYFYCHGGTTEGGTAFLQVGAPGSDVITSQSLVDIEWKDPRPLIILNGCHTTDVSPEQVFELATGFLAFARASGVIGTEITIFESLARAFGEEFLRRFIDGREPLGGALRSTRLQMLMKLNPLGLVYMPLALPNLQIRA